MKPKEKTISKIDSIFEKIYATSPNLNSESFKTLKDLQDHIHSMNLHKAKVAYFSNVKSKLNFVLELLNLHKMDEVDLAMRELRKFL